MEKTVIDLTKYQENVNTHTHTHTHTSYKQGGGSYLVNRTSSPKGGKA
jgi:hypothetical protein